MCWLMCVVSIKWIDKYCRSWVWVRWIEAYSLLKPHLKSCTTAQRGGGFRSFFRFSWYDVMNFIHFPLLLLHSGSQGVLGPIPAVVRRRRSSTSLWIAHWIYSMAFSFKYCGFKMNVLYAWRSRYIFCVSWKDLKKETFLFDYSVNSYFFIFVVYLPGPYITIRNLIHKK